VLLSLAGLYGIRALQYHGIRSNRVGEFDKLNTLFLQANNYDLLYIGTSRCESHFRPVVIDSITGLHSYNAGIIGSGFRLQATVLEAYLEHSAPPKYLVIGCDFYNLNRQTEIRHFPRYFAFLRNRALFRGLRSADARVPAFKVLPPVSMPYFNDRYRYAALRGLSGRTIPFDRAFESGFVPAQLNLVNQFDELADSFRVEDMDAGMSDLQTMIHICRRNGIRPILVATPSSDAILDRVTNAVESIDRLQLIADRNRIPFLNYVRDSIIYDRALFADPNHLNARGATLFSRHFATDLKALIDQM
jgi:hypothetical protein